ncbi:DUF3027 domain-containing protein [Amycolatopsis sp. NPDC003865]
MTLLLTLDDGSVQRKLADAVEFARAAVLEETPEEQIGTHVGVTREDAVTASHLFEAQVPGYRGWRWSVTVALAGDDEPVTVSEVVLVPGPSALIAPAWVPWERRVRAGDLGVGDIFPTDENDPRLAPAYLQSDDPAVEEVSREAGLGRVHVLSRFGRTEAAARWHGGEFGPRSDMARSAPDVCGTCGFFVPLAGSLRGVFGVCSNDIAPADGHVVDVEYGCGAHSEVEVEVTSSVPVAELVYDDSLLDFTPAPPSGESEQAEAATAEPETAEPIAAQQTAAVPATGGAESEQAEVASSEPAAPADVIAEPEAVVTEAAADAVAEPEAVVTEATPAADAVAESRAAEVAAPEEVEPAQADAVAQPDVADAPVETDVPEPSEAEPTQAEVTDAVAEPGQVAEAEPAQVEVTDAVAEPGQIAEAEPTPVEVADAVAEPGQVAGAEPVQAEVAEPEAGDSPAGESATAQVGVPASAEPIEAEATRPESGGAAVAEPAQGDVAAAEPVEATAAEAGESAAQGEPAVAGPIEAEAPAEPAVDGSLPGDVAAGEPTGPTTQAEPSTADEAQARIDEQRDL